MKENIMEKGKVKIICLAKVHTKYLHTSEGKKIVGADNSILVTPHLAAQLCDGANWKLADEKDTKAVKTMKKKIKAEAQSKPREKENEDGMVEPEEEETEVDEDEESPEKVDEKIADSEIGDDETRDTLKRILKLDVKSKKDVKTIMETAEELAVETEDLTTIQVKMAIIKKLRGK
jgi:hypothetical protein